MPNPVAIPTTSCACGSTRSRTGCAELESIEDELDLLEAIGQQANPKLPSFKVGGTGKKGSWDCDLAEFRSRVLEAGDGLAAVCAEVANACAHRLGSAIRSFTLESAAGAPERGPA